MVKRTTLMIQDLSFHLLGSIFSTLTSFEHPFQRRSIELHLRDADRELLDPLRDPLFSAKRAPKSGKKKMKPVQGLRMRSKWSTKG